MNIQEYYMVKRGRKDNLEFSSMCILNERVSDATKHEKWGHGLPDDITEEELEVLG